MRARVDPIAKEAGCALGRFGTQFDPLSGHQPRYEAASGCSVEVARELESFVSEPRERGSRPDWRDLEGFARRDVREHESGNRTTRSGRGIDGHRTEDPARGVENDDLAGNGREARRFE